MDEGRNLPAIPQPAAFPDLPGAVEVLTASSGIPDIVRQLRRVKLDTAMISQQGARYAALDNLRANERGTLAAYEALHDGRVIIDLQATLSGAGDYDSHSGYMTPLLAISRPMDSRVWVKVFPSGVIDFHNRRGIRGRPAGHPFYSVTPGRADRSNRWRTSLATVPTMPPEIRKAHPDALRSNRYLLIWEATWQGWKQHLPRPPIDPALLEQVAGGLYAVVAVWDLTPVEVAALSPGPRF